LSKSGGHISAPLAWLRKAGRFTFSAFSFPGLACLRRQGCWMCQSLRVGPLRRRHLHYLPRRHRRLRYLRHRHRRPHRHLRRPRPRHRRPRHRRLRHRHLRLRHLGRQPTLSRAQRTMLTRSLILSWSFSLNAVEAPAIVRALLSFLLLLRPNVYCGDIGE
jgi:hypothetical protein